MSEKDGNTGDFPPGNSERSSFTPNKSPQSFTVKTYLRVRPTSAPSQAVKIDSEDNSVISFSLPKSVNQGYVNNTKLCHTFKFNGIFDSDCTQEHIFTTCAKPALEDVINGINATIFAYGQTGSGKTFTITGGPDCYGDRGLIPRCASHIFEERKRLSDCQIEISVSYLEIYHEKGYDLLSAGSARKINDLNRVILQEDEEGSIHFQNFSINRVSTEEEALNLLFIGDTNRIVAETPINDASSRSHCIFTIWVERRVQGSEYCRRAKLHLVDLAGSERSAKTGLHSDARLFRESCSINLALHFLEKVILALHSSRTTERHSVHVPYRNSLITAVLRDSLGGNCKTIMVGTIAIESECIDETVSTCRFAQAVSQVCLE
ncbi:kinesin motor domain-containing protein [Cardiosporidium cionae]|uniref:Kinesin-like protein n=1 Tax=Cardiosporidium cionae TaxID=476202 RepID=A0ABQ7JEZ0_9APIC|nr:kinesin motor domain-containing protein [Cardiosporidium cionae]|eukprot:KAF8822576.1 kinesin motor domain-containing protein [Cardiosporidium cionae]